MVILKKLKGSTLMETLVATVLIVVVFMIASMILNNLFSSSIKNNTQAIDSHLNELEYLYKTENLTLPYHDDFKSWRISITRQLENDESVVLFNATNSETTKSIHQSLYENR